MSGLYLHIPTYKEVPTEWLISFLDMHQPEGLVVDITKGVYVAKAVNESVNRALNTPGWDRFAVLEADMICPRDALLRHAAHTEPVVGSTYFQHTDPFKIVAYHPDWNNEYALARMLDAPGLYEVHDLGLGLTSIRRDVLEQMAQPRFEIQFDADVPGMFRSHDYVFSRKVRDLGFKLYIDTAILCGHLTEIQVTEKHHLYANTDHFMALSVAKEAGIDVALPHELRDK